MQTVLELPQTDTKTSQGLKSIILQAIEKCVHAVFFDVSWEIYCEIIEETPERRNPQITFDKGVLEIMPLPEHDYSVRLIDLIIELLSEEAEIDLVSYGSSTQHKENIERGFEPDSSFYFGEKAKQIRFRKRFLENDSAPDLVFEADITHSSLDKFPIFAEFGVGEIWHYSNNEIQIRQLNENKYVQSATSAIFPNLTGEVLKDFLETSKEISRSEWREKVRTWARENLQK